MKFKSHLLLGLTLLSALAGVTETHAQSPLIELANDRMVVEGGIRAHQGVDVLLRLRVPGWQTGEKTIVARFDLEGGFRRMDEEQILRSAKLKFTSVQELSEYLVVQDQDADGVGTRTELLKRKEFMTVQIESDFSVGLKEMYQVDILGVRISSAYLSSPAVMTFANLAVQGLGAKILHYVSNDKRFDGMSLTKLEMDLGLSLWMNRPVTVVFGVGGSIGMGLGLNRISDFGVEADGNSHASLKLSMNGWAVGIMGTLRFLGDTANKTWINAFDYALTAELLL